MVLIIVTGTPGTGKSTIAKALAGKFSLKYLDVNDIIASEKLSESYDRKRGCKVVDTKKLSAAIVKIVKASKENMIVDSHLSHYVPADLVSLCIVTRCDIKVLKSRLEERGYEKAKIRENVDCEIFDTCLTEALEFDHNVIVIDTTSNPVEKSVEEIVEAAKERGVLL